MLQAKTDVDTLLAMGIMEDVSIVPQPAGGNIPNGTPIYIIKIQKIEWSLLYKSKMLQFYRFREGGPHY